VGTATEPVTHMISQLESMNRQLASYVQPNKKPQFVLTNGNAMPDGSCILLDPKQLTSGMLNKRNGVPNLFFACDVPSCRMHKKKGRGLQRCAAPKFALRLKVHFRLPKPTGECRKALGCCCCR
jgi:hypothetical protein